MLASIAKKQDCTKLHFRFDTPGTNYVLLANEITILESTNTIEIKVSIPFNILGIGRVSLFYNGEELYTGVGTYNFTSGDTFKMIHSFNLGV